jgi:hypothetical protein
LYSAVQLTAATGIDLSRLGTRDAAKLDAGTIASRTLEAAATTTILLVAEQNLSGHGRAGKEKAQSEELHDGELKVWELVELFECLLKAVIDMLGLTAVRAGFSLPFIIVFLTED